VGIAAGIFINATMIDSPYRGFDFHDLLPCCIGNQNPVGSSTRKPEKVIQFDKDLVLA
jgi:hypothetical protein